MPRKWRMQSSCSILTSSYIETSPVNGKGRSTVYFEMTVGHDRCQITSKSPLQPAAEKSQGNATKPCLPQGQGGRHSATTPGAGYSRNIVVCPPRKAFPSFK